MSIEVSKLTKIYNQGKSNEYIALNSVSCTIESGKWTTIVGPSGAGKTTFLKCISGIEDSSSGSIDIFNQRITELNNKDKVELRKKDIAFIFQEYNLIDDLKMIENIYMDKKEFNIQNLISSWDLEKVMFNFPGECSGGQQQKAAILRALSKESKILFCDEPTGALDSKSSKEVLQKLREINQSDGITIVMVTHNPLIEQISDFVITIQDGKIKEHKENLSPKKVEEIKW